jgi:Mrp family chromosome partitioning ATPase
VKGIIESARKLFDVVIVDSGPIPGSLEASAVAVAVDGVVMLVARGEPRAVVEECLIRLRQIKAPLAGVVLNRVNGTEMYAYGGSVSLDSRKSSSSGIPPLLPRGMKLSSNVGPIASAVVCSAPAGNID